MVRGSACHPARDVSSAHLLGMKRTAQSQPAPVAGETNVKPRRGKTSASSTPGSFAPHAHGVPEVDLANPAPGPIYKAVTALEAGDRLADGSLLVSVRHNTALGRTDVEAFDGQSVRQVTMVRAVGEQVEVASPSALDLADQKTVGAEIDRLTEKALPAALPFHPWTGEVRTDLKPALIEKTRAYVRGQVEGRLRKALAAADAA